MNKKSKSELIWEIILCILFFIEVIVNTIYLHQGKLTSVEINFFDLILFGFLITWTKIDNK